MSWWVQHLHPDATVGSRHHAHFSGEINTGERVGTLFKQRLLCFLVPRLSAVLRGDGNRR